MQLVLTNNNYDLDNFTVINDISLLDIMVDDSECTVINVESFLSNFEMGQIKNVLQKLLSKLRINGTIIISDLELETLALSHLIKESLIEEFNQIAFSNPNLKSFLTIEFVLSALKEFGLVIEMSYIENNFFVIRARRVN